ncbi:envelope stress response membrane protein PspB [uncultured Sphingomonas sp.]|jgi:phage shock protein B|uniref:envelope stress response membrane protein PspB n=1 Tax=uncultured Sphingomonas sp. TaxID=158754 RepID=UPI00262FC52E|nr:envelope stress response membrane protein PspB [uncultured Sphingomonas sp.]
MEDVFLPIMICGMLFIGLPWIGLHYISQWRRARGLSMEDENLLDGLHDLARRLDERLATIERIVAADDPNWRPSVPDRSERTPRGMGRDADDWQGRA